MSKKPTDELINDLFEGVITHEELVRLEAELLVDANAQESYKDHVMLQCGLEQMASYKVTSVNDVISFDEVLRRQKIRNFKRSSLAAAAIFLLLGVALYFVHFARQGDGSAMITMAPRSVINRTGQPAEEGQNSRLSVGSVIELAQGSLQLTLDNGVQGYVIGPAKFEYSAENALRLDYGSAYFDVPPAGHGFEVLAGDLRVVDLGTKFGVSAIRNEAREVHVVQGRVLLSGAAVGHSLELAGSQAVKIDDAGEVVEIPLKRGNFIESLPEDLLYLQWSFESIVDGRVFAGGNHPILPELRTELVESENHPDVEAGGWVEQGPFGDALKFGRKGMNAVTNWHGVAGDSPRTICFWAKLDASRRSTIVSWGRNADKKHASKWKLELRPDHDGQWLFGTNIGKQVSYSPVENFVLGDWCHYASVYTGRVAANGWPEIEHYINGQRVTSEWKSIGKRLDRLPSVPPQVATSSVESGARPLSFGKLVESEPGRPNGAMSGAIDEVFLFAGALKQEEILHLMQYNRLP
ncbi:LamG-like jellyroll fold domain-containing protein [Persicirhabdus sediminis]|uniref:FecR domain-containing protein n=1 Tax=Persicirhabdus sediminis TaxID=454144 RepID=A0A8J7MCE5_9BACT|nr:LamG-like jellyroll fold domain-containing protein [Persicirhabdus sediminis]MBK1790802.1 FecR domain-containing protein [Persicirhabdus sediminis]